MVTDKIYDVLLKDGRNPLFHVEFQGRTTHRPMKWRVLDTMLCLGEGQPGRTCYHLVFYTGRNAGRNDPGVYQVYDPDGNLILTWSYRIIRLWEIRPMN
ncbi:MAG: hypothetical protein HC837_16415 [Chloroflexaceae bacterium]|nr:hypothetical protein [Chloroflexaceae bacterium]